MDPISMTMMAVGGKAVTELFGSLFGAGSQLAGGRKQAKAAMQQSVLETRAILDSASEQSQAVLEGALDIGEASYQQAADVTTAAYQQADDTRQAVEFFTEKSVRNFTAQAEAFRATAALGVKRGTLDLIRTYEQGDRVAGAQVAFFSAGNIDLGSGSPLVLAGDTAARTELDAQIVRSNTQLDYANALNSASSAMTAATDTVEASNEQVTGAYRVAARQSDAAYTVAQRTSASALKAAVRQSQSLMNTAGRQVRGVSTTASMTARNALSNAGMGAAMTMFKGVTSAFSTMSGMPKAGG